MTSNNSSMNKKPLNSSSDLNKTYSFNDPNQNQSLDLNHGSRFGKFNQTFVSENQFAYQKPAFPNQSGHVNYKPASNQNQAVYPRILDGLSFMEPNEQYAKYPIDNFSKMRPDDSFLLPNTSFNNTLDSTQASLSVTKSFSLLGGKSEQKSMIVANSNNAKESSLEQAEEIMKSIGECKLNCISLLNEVASKVKKRIDYSTKENTQSKVKVFECYCMLDGKNIGYGRGNAKQQAKSEAANKAVQTLVTEKEYEIEKAHITLSLKKITDVAPPVSSSSGPTNPIQTIRQEIFPSSSAQQPGSEKPKGHKESEPLMNDSAIYEINLIAKECFIEPEWVMSPAGGPNGEFEVQLIFDKLTATGKGRKKVDAKRDASMKIIKQIRSSKELSEKYNPKARKLGATNATMFEVSKNDRAKNFFESCLDAKYLREMETSSGQWKESVMKLNRDFDEYLENVLLQYDLDEDTMDTLKVFFEKISKYTNMITSKPKQVFQDAPKHLADCITDCHLIPIGSFALNCMKRKDQPITIDGILLFQETQRISEKECLELYRDSLLEVQRVAFADNPQSDWKIKVSIERSEISDYVVIQTGSTSRSLVLQIQLKNLSQSSGDRAGIKNDPSIAHIKRIYDCFEETEKLKQFRNLMKLMRLWRANNKLFFLAPELLDAVLLNEVLNNKAATPAGYIINCLVIMNSEETFTAILNKCGPSYVKLLKHQNAAKASRRFTVKASMGHLFVKTKDQVSLRKWDEFFIDFPELPKKYRKRESWLNSI